MNTLVSIILFVLLLCGFLFASHEADSGAQKAIRGYGILLSIAFLAVALFSSWWIALLLIPFTMIMIHIASRL